jgi:hypothetical protein
MSRKRRLKKLEKQLAGLIKSVSRLEGGNQKARHRRAEPPAKRPGSAKGTDTVRTRPSGRAGGRRATTAPSRTSTRSPRAPKAAGKHARRTGGAALSALPS